MAIRGNATTHAFIIAIIDNGFECQLSLRLQNASTWPSTLYCSWLCESKTLTMSVEIMHLSTVVYLQQAREKWGSVMAGLADLRMGCQEASRLHVTTNLLRELETGRCWCKLQGWMPSQGGRLWITFAWHIQYIKPSEVLYISKCPHWKRAFTRRPLENNYHLRWR